MIHFKRTNQGQFDPELPDGSEDVLFTRFPDFIESRIKMVLHPKKYTTRQVERKTQRIFWGLMQSKSLTAQIPKSMIQACYEKHREILTKETKTSVEVLNSFRNFVKPIVQKLSSEYVNKTYLATNHAAFEAKRGEGGIKGTIKDQLKLTSSPHWAQPGSDRPRLEPILIVLSGKPGCGKSLMIEKTISKMAKFFDRSYASSVYHRNCNTDHWDGYTGQPIVVYDDFAQKQGGLQKPDKAFEELITICSSAQYLVPMADLKSKGMKFTSSIVILSTNHARGDFFIQNDFAIQYREAMERRIGNNFFEHQDKHIWKRYPFRKAQPYEKMGMVIHSDQPTGQFTPAMLAQTMLSQWKVKSDFHRNKISPEYETFQPIGFSDKFQEYGYTFNHPPSDMPHCKVQVLPEACKGRTITKHPANCHVLKPLQKALFKIVSDYKCMKPCKTPSYLKEVNDLKQISDSLGHTDAVWVSGDYSSATDGLHFDLSQVAMEEIATVMEDIDPVVAAWVRHEGGQHLLVYPEHTNLSPAIQTNGQLMGSLLSFPILCLANAFTLVYSCGYKMDTMPALFHGDDLAARMPLEDYFKWKSFAGQIGLTLSPGKNYVNKNWVSIDSQVYFVTGSSQQMEKLPTGRYGCFVPTSAGLKECLRNRTDFDSKMLIKASGLDQKGLKTPRSIFVSETFGGIVPTVSEDFHGVNIITEEGRAPQTKLEKTIYGLKLASKKPKKVVSFQSEEIWKMPRRLLYHFRLKQVQSLTDEEQLEQYPEDEVDKESLGPEAYLWGRIRKFNPKKIFGVDSDNFQTFSKRDLEIVNALVPHAIVRHLSPAWKALCTGRHALSLPSVCKNSPKPRKGGRSLKRLAVQKSNKTTTRLSTVAGTLTKFRL
jgi:hypothetical protein